MQELTGLETWPWLKQRGARRCVFHYCASMQADRNSVCFHRPQAFQPTHPHSRTWLAEAPSRTDSRGPHLNRTHQQQPTRMVQSWLETFVRVSIALLTLLLLPELGRLSERLDSVAAGSISKLREELF